MGAYRISAPVPEFTGEVGGLAFAKGVYEGDVPDGVLIYFKAQGYSVEELGAAADPVPGDDESADTAPAKPASKAAAAKSTDGGESK